MRNYVTEEEGKSFNINYDYVQSWDHEFSIYKTRNENLMIRYFLETSRAKQQLGIEILVFLAKFWFATKEHMTQLLRMKGVQPQLLEEVLEEYLSNRIINCFTLAQFPLDELPSDAMRIYCLDHGAKFILMHFYREDFVHWQTTDNNRGSEQIVKCLSTCRFYLSLLAAKGEELRVFEPIFDVSIGRRETRFSANFEILKGGQTRKFILESVRTYDLPTYWRKKVAEQISPFIVNKFWRQTFPEEPVFILLAETEESALEAADIFYRRTTSQNFRVTTDIDVAKGMEKARFYKYVPPEDDAGIGTLSPVRATVFFPKER